MPLSTLPKWNIIRSNQFSELKEKTLKCRVTFLTRNLEIFGRFKWFWDFAVHWSFSLLLLMRFSFEIRTEKSLGNLSRKVNKIGLCPFTVRINNFPFNNNSAMNNRWKNNLYFFLIWFTFHTNFVSDWIQFFEMKFFFSLYDFLRRKSFTVHCAK